MSESAKPDEPTDYATLLFERARAAWDADLPAATVETTRAYLGEHPENSAAWCQLGIALYEMARYVEAREALVTALKLAKPASRRIVLSQFGHMYRAMGRYRRAARWYRRAIKAAPDEASGYIYLGAVLAKSGELTAAEEVHRAAARCAKGCIDEAYHNLGLVLRAQERYAEAAECFRKAVELDPEYAHAKEALADVEQMLPGQEGEGL